MFQDDVQLFIKVFCVSQARYFKDWGNHVLSLDGTIQVKTLHIIVIVAIFQLL